MPFDGIDLLPVPTGNAELEADRPLFFRRRTVRVRQNQNLIRQSAVRQSPWKCLRTYSKRDNTKFTATLYNLENDIAEEKNLAPTNPKKLKAMSACSNDGNQK